VTAAVTGLSAGTSYCIALLARNGSGTTITDGPSPLPATVEVTVYVDSGGALLTGSNAITGPPGTFTCQRKCALGFPRGTQLPLQAMPGPRWTFLEWWNPPSFIDTRNRAAGVDVNTGPCTDSRDPLCTITLTNDVTAIGEFEDHPHPPCVLIPAGPRLSNGSLTVRVKCDTPVTVDLTGILHVRSKTGRRSAFAISGVDRAGSRATWTLYPRLPPDAVAALTDGAVESVRFTLTYHSPTIGTGLATVDVAHLFVSHRGAAR
jgi:hypothetical protein